MYRFTYCMTCWSLLGVDYGSPALSLSKCNNVTDWRGRTGEYARADFVLCKCNAKTFSCDCEPEWCCTECWRPTSYIEPGKGYCNEGHRIVSTTQLHRGALAYYQEGIRAGHFFAQNILRR